VVENEDVFGLRARAHVPGCALQASRNLPISSQRSGATQRKLITAMECAVARPRSPHERTRKPETILNALGHANVNLRVLKYLPVTKALSMLNVCGTHSGRVL
jgi:hypothetical protein